MHIYTIVLALIIHNAFIHTILAQDVKKDNRGQIEIKSNVVKFTGIYTTKGQKGKTINGEAFFLIEEMRADLSIKGTLILLLSSQAKNIISETTSEPLASMNEKLEYSAFAFLKRNTECPDIIITLYKMNLSHFSGKIKIENLLLPLDFKETPQEISEMFCAWAKSNNAGRGHTYQMGNAINVRIKNKKDR